MLAPLLATYGPALAAPTLSYQFDAGVGPRLQRNGVPIYTADNERNAVLHFEGDMYAAALAAAGQVWLLHAAGVVIDGRAFVFAGESGDGKSTAATAMVARGADYISDEWIAIDREARVVGMARPIMFDAGQAPTDTAGVARAFSEKTSYDFDTTAGERRSYELWQPPRVCHAPVPLAAILRVRHDTAELGGHRQLSAGEAVTGLWPCTVNAHPDTLHAAALVLARCEVFDIVSNQVSQLCEIVDAIAELFPGRG